MIDRRPPTAPMPHPSQPAPAAPTLLDAVAAIDRCAVWPTHRLRAYLLDAAPPGPAAHPARPEHPRPAS
jgi:hypothetical protein